MSATDKDAILRDIVKTYDNLVRAELGDFGQPAAVWAQEKCVILLAAIEDAARVLDARRNDRCC